MLEKKPNTMEPLLQIRGLEKSFGHKKALNGIDLTVRKGEFLALFGPNGAGKTTLLKAISTIIRPTRGEIYFQGNLIDENSIVLRSSIGLVSHNTLLYEDLTAYENLVFYSRMYGVDGWKKRVEQVLHTVGLYHRKDDVVRTFSRGMLQRLSIARAILHEPEILLLDEPYTGLDAQAIKILDELLESLKDGNRTFIMTSHDIHKGFEHATRLSILNSGKIVFDRYKDEVRFEDFEKEFWKWVGQEDRAC